MTQRTRKTRAKRKPHNAGTLTYDSFFDLLKMVADEPRKATIAGEEVTITRTEALLRVTIDRALQGKTRELTKLLQFMAKNPGLAATSRTQLIYFVRGALADV